jgi:uncharacterized LabA/DUF88 family protein
MLLQLLQGERTGARRMRQGGEQEEKLSLEGGMRIPMRPYEGWLWGGSLLLAVLTRQVALGLVPLALAHGQWQRRQLEQQFQSQQQQIVWQVQQQFQSVHTSISSLRTTVSEAVAVQEDPRVTQIAAEVGSLAEQVKQLQEQPRSHLSIRQQMVPLVQRLHLVQEDLRQLRLQTLPQQQLQGQVSQVQHPMEELEQQRVNPSPRSGVGAFIDGANLHASARSLGLHLDYDQLLPRLLEGKTPAEIHFYSGYDPQNPKQKAFHQYLKGQLGFHLHLKPVVRFANGSCKANLDGEMIVDMLRGGYERVILLSGDGDFFPALQHLQTQGIPVEVAAFLPDTHRRLRQFSFTDLSQLLAPGQKVIPLPAKQVAPRSQMLQEVEGCC